jgi:hypothetical protein
MTTGILPHSLSKTCSAKAFVYVYVFGHLSINLTIFYELVDAIELCVLKKSYSNVISSINSLLASSINSDNLTGSIFPG